VDEELSHRLTAAVHLLCEYFDADTLVVIPMTELDGDWGAGLSVITPVDHVRPSRCTLAEILVEMACEVRREIAVNN
jgi:hypothetical protein